MCFEYLHEGMDERCDAGTGQAGARQPALPEEDGDRRSVACSCWSFWGFDPPGVVEQEGAGEETRAYDPWRDRCVLDPQFFGYSSRGTEEEAILQRIRAGAAYWGYLAEEGSGRWQAGHRHYTAAYLLLKGRQFSDSPIGFLQTDPTEWDALGPYARAFMTSPTVLFAIGEETETPPHAP